MSGTTSRGDSGKPIAFRHQGRSVAITKNDRWPEYYLWLTIDGQRTFFFGVLEGQTRGELKRRALRWIREHPTQFAGA